MSQHKRKSDSISNGEDNTAEEYSAKNDTSTSDEYKDITVILDLASLEIVKTKKGDFQLLNCDDHIRIMKV